MWTIFTACAVGTPKETAEGPFEPAIVFITSLPDLDRRLEGTDALTALIKAAEGVVFAWDEHHPAVLGEEVDIWLAIKPGGQMRVWVSGDVPAPRAIAREISASLAALPPPKVRNGLVALTITMCRGENLAKQPPIPPEWLAAYSGFETTEGLILEVWPN